MFRIAVEPHCVQDGGVGQLEHQVQGLYEGCGEAQDGLKVSFHFLLLELGIMGFYINRNSVADPGCLSRIPDLDFYPSRIPDPGSKNSNNREG